MPIVEYKIMANREYKNIIHDNQISVSLLLDDLIQKLLGFFFIHPKIFSH